MEELLFNAIKSGNTTIVQKILDQKGETGVVEVLTSITSNNRTPYGEAILYHQPEVMEIFVGLLSRDIHFNILQQTVLKFGRTLSHVMFSNDFDGKMSSTVLESLDPEQEVALLSVPDNDGWTPLHLHVTASVFKTADLLQLMFEDLTHEQRMSLLMLQTMNGETPIHLAAKHNSNHSVIQILLSGLHQGHKWSLLTIKDNEGRTPIHNAALCNENPAVLDILLSWLINSEDVFSFVGMCDKHNWTPVHMAARYNDNAEIMCCMLGLVNIDRQIALIGMRLPDGNSALHIAIQYNHSIMVKEMLRSHTQHSTKLLLCSRNNAKRTPIEVDASSLSSVEAVLTMLNTAVKMLVLTAANSDLVTPVHWAAANNHHLMQVLLSALSVQQRVEVLKMQAHDGKTPIEMALFGCRKGDGLQTIEMIDSLIGEKIADILSVRASQTGNTLLHTAMDSNTCPQIISSLFEKMDNSAKFCLLGIANNEGWTPIHVAANCKVKQFSMQVVFEMLTGEQITALLKTKTNENQTPIHLAAKLRDGNVLTEMIKAVPDHSKRSLLCLSDGERRNPLHLAAKFSSSSVAIQKLFQGVDTREVVGLLKQTTKDKQTPLHIAAQFNENHEVVAQLLWKIPDDMLIGILSLTDSKNLTIMHVAARYTNHEVLRVILERIRPDQKIDIFQNAVNEEGFTPMHMAAQFNKNELVTRTLVEAVPDDETNMLLGIQTKGGETPLHLSLKYNKNEKVSIVLLSYSHAESKVFSLKNEEGLTAMHVAAAYSEKPEALRLFMRCLGKESQALQTDDRGWLPLHFAARYNGNACVMEILFSDRLLHQKADDQWTPIQLAARYNPSQEVIRSLLSQRLNEDLLKSLSEASEDDSLPSSHYVMPPVHLAASFNSDIVMRALLESLDMNQRLDLIYMRDKDYRSPLHLAAEFNEDANVIAALLKGFTNEKAQALLRMENLEGFATLQLAAKRNRNPEVIQVILARFDVDERQCLLSRGEQGLGTPIHLAVMYNTNTAVLEALMASMGETAKLEFLGLKNADGRTPIDLAILHNNNIDHINAIMTSIASKTSMVELINNTNSNTMSAVHLAASRSNARVLNGILSYLSIDERVGLFNTQTERGWTPLHFAAQCENANVMASILAGLNSDQQMTALSKTTTNGWTPFHFAAQNNSNDVWNLLLKTLPLEDIIRMLCMKTTENLTPVILAFSNGHCAAMKVLKPGILLPLIITAKDSVNIDQNNQIIHLLESLLSTDCHFASLQDYLANNEVLGRCTRFLTPVLDSLSSIIERKHHVTRWKDTSGNNLLHIAAAADHQAFITRVIQTQDMTEISDALRSRNSYGCTPYHSCKSGQLPNILAWTEQQSRSYPLLQPPSVLIFYSDTDRPGCHAELRSFEDALPSIGVTEPRVKLNPTKQEIFAMIRKSQEGEVSALVVVVMSHGDSGRVSVADGQLALKEIMMQMNSSKLKGIPKILILQACQTTQMMLNSWHDQMERYRTVPPMSADAQDQEEQKNYANFGLDAMPGSNTGFSKVHTRVQPNRSLPGSFDVSGPDMLVLAATINNQLASRNVMIPKLAHNIRESSTDADLHDIFLQTTDEVRREVPAQVPEYRSTARLKICLKQVYSPKTKYKSDAKMGLWDRLLKTLK